MNDKLICPCKDCAARKILARTYDMHIWGEDCPYVCRQYDEWKNNLAARGREKLIKATVWLIIATGAMVLVTSVWAKLI